jgi:hypothetical protein
MYPKFDNHTGEERGIRDIFLYSKQQMAIRRSGQTIRRE